MSVDFNSIFNMIFILNIVFVLIIIFFERQSPVHALAWIIALMFLPVVGFLAYVLVGRGLSPVTLSALRKKGERDETYNRLLEKQLGDIEAGKFHADGAFVPLISFNLRENDSLYTHGNTARVFTSGKEKFAALFEDIEGAKRTIHLCYFIYKNDNLGHKLLDLLIKKAKEGIAVRLMYDSFGSAFTPHSMFRALEKAGGQVIRFFPSYIGVSFLTLRVNFRNHRKIAVIDGAVAYTGGMNVGDEYLGLDRRVKPWRDTHIRLSGPAAGMLQRVFLSDWLYAAQERMVIKPWRSSRLDRVIEPETLDICADGEVAGTGVGVQILSSGPESYYQDIKLALIKAVTGAKRYVYMQTPYFTPDDSFMDALRIAAMSGVDVRIILPGIKDKDFVFRATLSYARDLIEQGVSVYLYNGFMHAKMVVSDDEWVTIGTTNLDVRSFRYNFEDNAFCYSREFAARCREIFEDDVKNSVRINKGWFDNRSPFLLAWESLCRLLTPLL